MVNSHYQSIIFKQIIIQNIMQALTFVVTVLPPLIDLLIPQTQETKPPQPPIQERSILDEIYDLAKTIYYNGNIITVNQKQQYASMVAIDEKGIICFVGNQKISKAMLEKDEKTHRKFIDLKGKTMMPAFYDAHSHIAKYSGILAGSVDLSSPPIGDVLNIDQLIQKMKKYIQDNQIPQGDPVCGSHYSNLFIEQKRNLTRFQLDKISQKHMIIIKNANMHSAYVNTYTLKTKNITKHSQTVVGTIQLDDNQQPTGFLKQNALKLIDDVAPKLNLEGLKKGAKKYLEAGITTAQEGFMDLTDHKIFKQMKKGDIDIDIRSYYGLIGQTDTKKFIAKFEQVNQFSSQNYKVQGIKLVLDGSIQGYTGFLTQPYFITEQQQQKLQELQKIQQTKLTLKRMSSSIMKFDEQKENVRKISIDSNASCCSHGVSAMSQDFVEEIIQMIFSKDLDVLIHVNGDAAIDSLIQGVRNARTVFADSKSLAIACHAQMARQDQIVDMKAVGITPTFFVSHTYYFGDLHRTQFLGEERAKNISPTGWALQNNLRFTAHNDAPVLPQTPSAMFDIMWCAVNRLTKSNYLLGPEQRISVKQAIRMMTIDAAWQGREDHRKGSIEEGKEADLIIVSANPLKVDPEKELRTLHALQTIKKGKVVFRKQ